MMDAWDLQADSEQAGKGFVDSFSQSQQGCESQVPFYAASQASQYGSPPPWSQAPQQQPPQFAATPRQPAVPSRQQPQHAYSDWLRRPLPAQRQPAAGRSLLGRRPAVACTPICQPQQAAPRTQPPGSQPHTGPLQPSVAAAAPQQATATAAAAPSAAPVSSMSLEAYCQVHSLLTGGHATAQQLHASQAGAIRSQGIKQVHLTSSKDGRLQACSQ